MCGKPELVDGIRRFGAPQKYDTGASRSWATGEINLLVVHDGERLNGTGFAFIRF